MRCVDNRLDGLLERARGMKLEPGDLVRFRNQASWFDRDGIMVFRLHQNPHFGFDLHWIEDNRVRIHNVSADSVVKLTPLEALAASGE